MENMTIPEQINTTGINNKVNKWNSIIEKGIKENIP